ncbi:MAG: PQQ-binding-like beta-propeller repeat protein, partial [Rickettsiaceae bacterium]|nr:PQQ-binding-like beta-propeller repeat protein [Rickettsiaceae bacterium]
MNTKFLQLFSLFLLVSCNGPNKTKSITEFTAQLEVNSKASVQIETPSHISNIGNQIDYVKKTSSLILEKPKLFSAKSIFKLNNPLAALPTATNEHIYLITENGDVICYDARVSKKIWQNNIGTKGQKIDAATISFDKDKLIITADIYLFKLDSQNGQILGKVLVDDIVRDYPEFNGDKFFLKTAGNKLIAYNSTNLNQLWQVQTWSDNVATLNYKSPIIYNNRIIQGYSSGQIIANNLQDGDESWQINLLSAE